MNAQDLKSSILQRAIEGKLVPQRKEEGTAKELLAEIRAEKARLIKEKKIKKSKPLPEITDEEKPFDIPDSWEWARLGDICSKIGSGKTPDGGRNSDAYKQQGIPLFREQNIYNDGLNYNGIVYISEELSNTRLGSKVFAKDLLLNITGGSIGRCAIVPDDFSVGDINQHILIIRLIRPELRSWIHAYICSPDGQNVINRKAVGAKAGFSAAKCKSMLIPIPNLAEQNRIVAKIEELQPDIDAYDKAQTKLRTIEQRFPDAMKKSLLQYAIEGKLVPQRKEEGTAKELLAEIRAEKARLVKEKKIKKSKPFPEITDEETPFDIPESWEWVRIGELFSLQAGKNIKATYIYHEQTESHVYPCYGGNGVRGFVEFFNSEGDFPIIGRQGALCGNINRAKGKFYATEHAVLTTTFANTDVSWACYFLKALNLNQYATATAQPGLAVSKINQVLIPLPPLAEQHRIVAKLEELLPLCQHLTANP
ncbi:MAG: restriction endonuclease subunit S [Mitsuokella jalaludinii]|uniref:restriction endonuclease subunit S n=1 Tax=Mitsuokella jalaludinii TaxID=187979 RepID=UPI00242E9440|nr:restriction endonuclease subunit S [Mitsuokella jalaludinii]MDD7744610.1 restriction endonuclease subunit S [Mitsuokella jalaludinii]